MLILNYFMFYCLSLYTPGIWYKYKKESYYQTNVVTVNVFGDSLIMTDFQHK